MSAKAKQVTKEATQEVDLIVETVSEIESMTKEEAFLIVPSLLENVDFSYFKLGGVLSAIQENGWWEGHTDNFKEFIPETFGLHWRKGYYLIRIYDRLVEADIPWAKVSDLGWTKLKELADILTNENVDEWVAKANTLSVLQLIAAVKAFKELGKTGLSTDGTTAPDSSGVSTITFTVHPDQKETIKQAIDQALDESDTEFKGVALEAICLNYLAGGSTKAAAKPLSLSGTMEKYTVGQVLDAFEVVFPETNITAELEPD